MWQKVAKFKGAEYFRKALYTPFVTISFSIFTRFICCCSGIDLHFDLHFSHQSTLISRRQNVSPSWAVWRLCGPCVPLFVCTDEQGTFRRLEIAPKDEQDLWSTTIFFWGLGWFLLFFPWCQAKKILSLKVGLEIQVHLQLTQIMSISPTEASKARHHFLEFYKLFKGTGNLVYVNFWPHWNCDTVNYKWNNLSVKNCWKNDLCHKVDVLTDLPKL